MNFATLIADAGLPTQVVNDKGLLLPTTGFHNNYVEAVSCQSVRQKRHCFAVGVRVSLPQYGQRFRKTSSRLSWRICSAALAANLSNPSWARGEYI